MFILGLILLILGLIFAIKFLWIIGIVVLVLGVGLFILGALGRAIFGRRYWY